MKCCTQHMGLAERFLPPPRVDTETAPEPDQNGHDRPLLAGCLAELHGSLLPPMECLQDVASPEDIEPEPVLSTSTPLSAALMKPKADPAELAATAE